MFLRENFLSNLKIPTASKTLSHSQTVFLFFFLTAYDENLENLSHAFLLAMHVERPKKILLHYQTHSLYGKSLCQQF
jgi:hypothetical protein